MSEKREQRFCLCGYPVFGTEQERVNAFIAHHLSEEHKRRLEKARKTVGIEADRRPDV